MKFGLSISSSLSLTASMDWPAASYWFSSRQYRLLWGPWPFLWRMTYELVTKAGSDHLFSAAREASCKNSCKIPCSSFFFQTSLIPLRFRWFGSVRCFHLNEYLPMADLRTNFKKNKVYKRARFWEKENKDNKTGKLMQCAVKMLSKRSF